MYRDGKEDINVFDRRKSRSSNLFGCVFYFSESKSHAEQYGKATPYYLISLIRYAMNTQLK